MLRIYSILQLQSVWDTIPSQKVSSLETLSRHSSDLIQPATLLTSAASLVLEDNMFTTSTSTTTSSSSTSSSSSSLPERASSLPTPSVSLSPSVHANDCHQPVHQDISQSDDPLYHHFEEVHPLNTATATDLHETPKPFQAASDISAAVSLPPPVPMKDPIHRFNVVPSTKSTKTNHVSDPLPKKKEKRLSKYGFFGSRSTSPSPPPPLPPMPAVSSMMISSPTSNHPSPPTTTANQLIDNANKTLRRETSKFNLRRKSLSKKVKRAISTIKLNGATEPTHASPLPPMTSN